MNDARRIALLAAVAAAALLQLSGCGQNQSAADFVVKANEHRERGELQSASIQLANALQQDPNHAEARWMLARVALELGDGPRAERDARKAMELGIAQADARPVLVKAILLQGDLDRAMTEATSLPANLSPAQQAVFLGLRGKAHVLKGELQQAQAVVEQALSLEPGAGDALVVKSVIHTLRRQYDDARAAVMLALEADDRSAEAWSSLGALELALGNAAEAEAAFGKAIERRRYATLDRARRALVRIQLERIDDADADIRTLGSQGWKDHPYVNYVIGMVRFNQNQYGEAATAFEFAHAAQPNFVPNRIYLAITRYLLGQIEQARHHAQWVHANAPRSQTAGQLLGVLNINLSDYAAARQVLQTALRNAPDNATTLHLLATVSLLEGDTQQGLEYANRLAVLEPESQQVREMQMVARLMAGEALEDAGGSQLGAEADQFTRDFLLALEAFRDNRLEDALERARTLHILHPNRVDPINLMAASYLASGQWDLAKVELEKVLALEPDNPSATRNLAKVELQGGNLERARTLLQARVEREPGDEEAAILLADMQFNNGDAAAGMSVLEQAVQHNPDGLDVRARLANAHLDSGNVTRVLELTRGMNNTQLRTQPALLELRGKAQMLAGDLSSARATFEQWTRLIPDSALARFHYGDSLARGGEAAQARTELERAVRLDRGYLPARIGEIKMLVHFGELDRARQALGKLREDFGKRSEVLGIEGWFALGTNDFSTAERHFTELLRQGPDPEVMILLSRALWAQAKHDAALTLMHDWLKSRPDDTPVLLQVAEAYTALGRDADARSSYEAVIKLHPEHVLALNNLAWLNREHDPARALEYAQRAHQLAPEDPHVLDTLGMLLVQRGDITRAYRFVSEAAERAPADAQIQLHLGNILVQQKRLDEARKVLEALVHQVPDSEAGKEAKALLETVRGTP